MSGDVFEGGCLCGAIRFRVSGPLGDAGYCHCTRCQRRTGTAASANVGVDGNGFEVVSGESLIRAWRHPDGGYEKCFCSRCGAHLFSRDPDDHTSMGMRISAFDADPGVELSYRQFLDYAASWEPVPDDGLKRYPESRRAQS